MRDVFLISIACPASASLAHSQAAPLWDLSAASCNDNTWLPWTRQECHYDVAPILRASVAKWNCICALQIKFNYFLTCSAILCVPQICLRQFVACFGASLVWHYEKCLNICWRTSVRGKIAENDKEGRYVFYIPIIGIEIYILDIYGFACNINNECEITKLKYSTKVSNYLIYLRYYLLIM